MKFGIKSVAAALLAGLVLTGCGQKEESKVLKVGAIAGPETELVEVAAKVAKEKYGLDRSRSSTSPTTSPRTWH